MTSRGCNPSLGLKLDTRHSSRRRFLVGAVAAAAAAGTGRVFAQGAQPIRLGQSCGMTGPLGEIGMAIHQGARACFHAVNTQGGVHGQRIDLIGSDDGYDLARSVENQKSFLRDPDMFALFSPMGTPMIEALLPLIRNTDISCFAPLTGGLAARPADMRNVFNVRAGYPEETERLIDHLRTLGIRKIAVAYQDNLFGKEVLQAAVNATQKHGLTLVVSLSIQNDASDAAAAAKRIGATDAEAALLGLAGQPAIGFVKSIRAERRSLPLYALSLLGAPATLAALGSDAYGIAMTQVVPMPSNAVLPVVRDYQQASRDAGVSLSPSHLGLEGYINARVFVEALRRSGPKPSRKTFMEATWSIKRFDLGGYEVNFDQPGRNASRFVELAMIGHAGKFIR
jgi:branched-chain amino acid transport system substrate-binding protein